MQTFRSARARLAACGTNLSETDAAEAFLASLPPSYDAFITTQTSLLDQGKAAVAAGGGRNITLADVIANFLAEELRRNTHKRHGGSSSNPSARALFTSKPKFRKGKRTFTQGNNPTSPKRKGLCNWCRIVSHHEHECRKKQSGEPRRPPTSTPQSHVAAASNTTRPTVLVCCPNDITHSNDGWFMDSGTTHHISRTREAFLNYTAYATPEILTVGNDAKCQILGCDIVLLRSHLGSDIY